MRKSSILTAILIMSASLLLSACVSSGTYNNEPWKKRQTTHAAQTPANISIANVERQALDAPIAKGTTPVKVAILLPLSGKHQKLGQAMLNAAQMALFDIAHDNFILIPKDTSGTANGARTAAKSAIKDGAQLVLGPVFSASVRSARQVTQSANVNMIAFSTDWRLASNKTFLISFLPFDQVQRVTSYAAQSGYKNIGALSPRSSYGEAVISAYKTAANNIGLPQSKIEHFSPNGSDLSEVIKKFSSTQQTPNAILIPAGGAVARQVSSFLDHYDMSSINVKRLGTGLMDDKNLARDKSLDGSWFAAPSPKSRQKFERQYNSIYYTKPPRIASLAYDAAALAAILARIGINQNNQPAFDYASITNSNGFNGVDGIFRFRPDGIVERGLAVLEYRRGSIIVIDPAPKTFQASIF